ncbi:uncharacterized protein UHOD_04500 [Ustilago sp. UG-2017b]|nr:uncharacterized protein UHOD_04500 [Ustilago sp. UG-2017b]
MRITRFSVVLLLTISLLLLSHAAEAGGGGGEASSSKSSGSKFNLIHRFKKTSKPPPLPNDNYLNLLKHVIPVEKFVILSEYFQEGLRKGYINDIGRPVNADGNRKAEESKYIEKLENDLKGYIELAGQKSPK